VPVLPEVSSQPYIADHPADLNVVAHVWTMAGASSRGLF
jgi:hypothetical protein